MIILLRKQNFPKNKHFSPPDQRVQNATISENIAYVMISKLIVLLLVALPH